MPWPQPCPFSVNRVDPEAGAEPSSSAAAAAATGSSRRMSGVSVRIASDGVPALPAGVQPEFYHRLQRWGGVVDNLPERMNPIALLPPPLRAAAEILLTLVMAALIAYLAQAFVGQALSRAHRQHGAHPAAGRPRDRRPHQPRFRDPARGEIVVFHPPICRGGLNNAAPAPPTTSPSAPAPRETFIKRVVGLARRDDLGEARIGVGARPGGHGAPVAGEPTCTGAARELPQGELPPKCYFMMGDNRGRVGRLAAVGLRAARATSSVSPACATGRSTGWARSSGASDTVERRAGAWPRVD